MASPPHSTHPGVTAAAYVHPSAVVYGDVDVGEGSSLWANVVVRCEMHQVRIGKYTNIQDFVMVHVGATQPTIIGSYCSITHHVTAHGCTIGDHCLIGIGATIMDGAVVGKGSIVGGHCIVTEGTVIPPRSIVVGAPGKVIRQRDSSHANIVNALMYHRNAVAYARGEYRAWDGIDMEALASEAEAILNGRG